MLKMGLYNLFSYNVEVQYKSGLCSKAMLFTFITTLLNVILPFIVAYRSRGFWLKSVDFFEQPEVQFTYNYLLIAETQDPSKLIVCSDTIFDEGEPIGEEHCAEIKVREYDYNGDGKNDVLHFKFHLSVPISETITSIVLVTGLDFKLKTVCPFHMQSLAVISKDFASPPSGFKYYGELEFHQNKHLPCLRNVIDTTYNTSLFNHMQENGENRIDNTLQSYFMRDVTTLMKTFHSRSQNGHTGVMNLDIRIRISETQVRYLPSILQELKWAWPQYLSLVFIFYWIFSKIKRFVFYNRLLMAWEVVPWTRSYKNGACD